MKEKKINRIFIKHGTYMNKKSIIEYGVKSFNYERIIKILLK